MNYVFKTPPECLIDKALVEVVCKIDSNLFNNTYF